MLSSNAPEMGPMRTRCGFSRGGKGSKRRPPKNSRFQEHGVPNDQSRLSCRCPVDWKAGTRNCIHYQSQRLIVEKSACYLKQVSVSLTTQEACRQRARLRDWCTSLNQSSLILLRLRCVEIFCHTVASLHKRRATPRSGSPRAHVVSIQVLSLLAVLCFLAG